MVYFVTMQQAISVHEASDHIQKVTPVLGPEMVPLADVPGRVLAESVNSTRELPPSDCSAMDGYAVHSEDLLAASESSPVRLSVVEEIPAGHRSGTPLPRQAAARIFTGAPVPEGADAVIRQEDTRVDGSDVLMLTAIEVGSNIRDAGEDIRIGDRVLEQGRVLGAVEIGLLASLGRSMVEVRRRPRVAILSGGDELVEVDGDVSGGRIVASNSYTIAAAVKLLGAEALYLGISRDRPESVEGQFRAALTSDCIVSTAGVSVGDHDHVRPVLEKLGCQLDFWGVRMKPGYPLAFGRFGKTSQAEAATGPLVFGLPGNPVSATVTFDQFVRPSLLKMMGRRNCFRPVLRARVAETLRKKTGRLHFVRVTLENHNGTWEARSTGNQSSGVLTSMTRADGLLIFPETETELAAGDEAVVQVLTDDMSTGVDLGF